MSTWPADLPQSPDRSSYSNMAKDNSVRSTMGYGPDKLRRRSTVSVDNVNMQLTLDTTQVNSLETFYNDTISVVEKFDWINHVTELAAVYRFKAPPNYTYFAPGYWVARLSLEIVPS